MIDAKPLLILDLQVGLPIEIGVVDGIGRRCIPITGGTVSGAYFGTVLPGGADWQQIRIDGSIDIDAQYILNLEDGLVEVRSKGIRTAPQAVLAKLAQGHLVDRSQYYFRTFMQFRTESHRMSRLNHILAVASGERLAGQVRLLVHEVE